MTDRPGSGRSGGERSDVQRSSRDAERLDDALFVAHGSRGAGSTGRLLYAVYLVALFGGIYGFTLWRGVLITPEGSRALAVARSGWGVLAVAVTVGSLAVGGWRLGRIRGPVVPPLPFIDHIVAAPLDRAVVLRQRLVLTLAGGLSFGLLLGTIIAGGVVGSRVNRSGVGGGATVFVGAAIGGASGLVAAVAWFAGQAGLRVRALAAAMRHGVSRGLCDGLRGLRLEGLRRHAIRTTHVGGAVLAGDLRAVRLDVSAPVTRARTRRLRPGGACGTLVRRDLLGLRRAPGRVVAGVALTSAGAALSAVCLTQRGAPLVLAIMAACVLYVGFGALAEGVRLAADNAGTPPLLGLGFRAQALAHLVVPVAGYLLIAVPVTTLAGLAIGGITLGAHGGQLAAAACVLAGLLGAATLLAAFRGPAPDTAFVPEFGPIAMTYWYARPLAVAGGSGGLLINRVANAGPNVAPVLVGGTGSALLLLGVGLFLARKLEMGHRI